MSDYTIEDVCVVACAEAFRGDGEIMASPMGPVPWLGARLAQATFEPDLVLTDGVATIVRWGEDGSTTAEGWMPYRTVFDVVWWGKRHVMMGASQIDQFGNQNISCVGDWKQPKVQLLGARGAPGNTINHQTSYYVAQHSSRLFVPAVDMVSGVGYDRANALSEAGRRFHEIRCVVTNLGVFDFATPDGRMAVRSLHPGVTLDEVAEATGFEVSAAADVPTTPVPSDEQLALIRRFRAEREAVR